MVSRLSRFGGLQPQRDDADVRDAGRQRRRGLADGVDLYAAAGFTIYDAAGGEVHDVAGVKVHDTASIEVHNTAGHAGSGAATKSAAAAPGTPSATAGAATAPEATPPGGAGRGQTAAITSPESGSGRGAAAAGPPTGRGGGQAREWYRGLPIPPGALANWSRRNNANYMQTGVLSGLQLTAMFPNLVVENFYQKTRNSIGSGKTEAPFASVIPVQRDQTRVAELVNILRAQGIEVGRAASEIKISDGAFPAGSYVIKRDQPYGRLAKNLLERQSYPDPNLRTYDDSGWTMGMAMLTEVREIEDKAILDLATTPVQKATVEGKVTGSGSAGLAVAHYGSNNMVAFRYQLRNVPMKITERATAIDGVDVPAGSFIVSLRTSPRCERPCSSSGSQPSP